MKIEKATQESIAAFIGIKRSTLMSWMRRNLETTELNKNNVTAILTYYSVKFRTGNITLSNYLLTLNPNMNSGSSANRINSTYRGMINK